MQSDKVCQRRHLLAPARQRKTLARSLSWIIKRKNAEKHRENKNESTKHWNEARNGNKAKVAILFRFE